MKTLSTYFKSSVLALTPYRSARDEYSGQEGIFLDANENPYGYRFNRYPDPYQKELKEAIGKWRGVRTESIFLGNGSDEIIDLLIRSTCEKGVHRILTLDPTYGMYKVSAQINEIPIDTVGLKPDLTVDEESLIKEIKEHHQLIFICSPNNPNGGMVSDAVIETTLKNASGLVVVDEAYIDFANRPSAISKLQSFSNLIVMQTFSKALGAAGIRIGMGFMHPELIGYLNKVKPPYNISQPNQEFALSVLSDLPSIEAQAQKIVAQREVLANELKKNTLVEYVFPSDANFLLVRFKQSDLVFNTLKEKKIILRDRSGLTHCKGCLRISVGTALENWNLINELKEIENQLTEI